MESKYEELIEACRKGHLYNFISNEAYRFDKEELIVILKNLDYAVYKRLGDQCKEVEQIVPECLDEYDFFGDTTAEEKAYFYYLSGSYSYQNYIDVCEQEEIEQPRARK